MKKKTPIALPESARRSLARQVTDADGKPVAGVQGAILKVLGVQRPAVLAYLRLLRRRHPGKSAAQLAEIAERDYLRAVTGTGAAGGATAVVPGLGTAASFGVSAGVAVAFLETSALYAQAVAELHGIAIDEPEEAKTLIMAVLLGDEGSAMLAGLSEQMVSGGPRGALGWGAVFSTATGKGGTWSAVTSELQNRFLRHFAASQGAGALGRAMPFGIGAAIGGVSNRVLGKRVVESTRKAFGPLPTLLPGELDAAISGAPDEAEGRALMAQEAQRDAGRLSRAVEAVSRRAGRARAKK